MLPSMMMREETVESASRPPSPNSLKGLLSECNFNCFDFTEKYPEISLQQLELFLHDPKSELDEHQHHLLEQSFRAMEVLNKEAYGDNRIVRAINEEVVTESESDNPDAYVSLRDPLSQTGKNIIMKRRAAIRRRARRAKAKVIAEQAYFSRKVSKRVSRVLRECPNIGQTIEDFVKASNVGADQWRRTGVLTFDGNTKLPMKVTYGRIKTHLEEVYQRSFSYGTIVQLCVPRNKRRRSAIRYQGVANVTSRRARKGFTLKYNPDSHWSGSLYKGLDKIQYRDGRYIVNINRDDSSGFRLDTLTTNKQYSLPTVQGHDTLTTRTDYVNKYPSTLQTTSYNFSATDTTSELCAGVVKASGSFPKNPAQHAADLMMLDSDDLDKCDLRPVFVNPLTGCPKSIDSVRVDGAADEGPGHDEVRFWWTQDILNIRRLLP